MSFALVKELYGGYKLLDINDYKEKKKENKRIKADTLKEILKVCDERQKPVIESIISDYINTIYLYLVSLKSFLSLILPLTYGKVYGRTGKKLRNKI